MDYRPCLNGDKSNAGRMLDSDARYQCQGKGRNAIGAGQRNVMRGGLSPAGPGSAQRKPVLCIYVAGQRRGLPLDPVREMRGHWTVQDLGCAVSWICSRVELCRDVSGLWGEAGKTRVTAR